MCAHSTFKEGGWQVAMESRSLRSIDKLKHVCVFIEFYKVKHFCMIWYLGSLLIFGPFLGLFL